MYESYNIVNLSACRGLSGRARVPGNQPRCHFIPYHWQTEAEELFVWVKMVDKHLLLLFFFGLCCLNILRRSPMNFFNLLNCIMCDRRDVGGGTANCNFNNAHWLILCLKYLTSQARRICKLKLQLSSVDCTGDWLCWKLELRKICCA